jgi:hypothetical protein
MPRSGAGTRRPRQCRGCCPPSWPAWHTRPHAPISAAGRQLSTLDLYGTRLVLLVGPAGHGQIATVAKLDVPVDSHQASADEPGRLGLTVTA